MSKYRYPSEKLVATLRTATASPENIEAWGAALVHALDVTDRIFDDLDEEAQRNLRRVQELTTGSGTVAARIRSLNSDDLHDLKVAMFDLMISVEATYWRNPG